MDAEAAAEFEQNVRGVYDRRQSSTPIRAVGAVVT